MSSAKCYSFRLGLNVLRKHKFEDPYFLLYLVFLGISGSLSKTTFHVRIWMNKQYHKNYVM